MTQVSTIKTPTGEGVIEARGYVAFLLIARKRVKCFLQLDSDGKPDKIAHYASGYLIPRASIKQNIALRYASNPYVRRPTMREAAQGAVNQALGAIDDEKVLAAFAAAPAINGRA